MEQWLGVLPVELHAEHGFWTRSPGGSWVARQEPSMEWREPARAILEQFAARTPGSLVEEKTAGLAWHYRMADPDFGATQANELRAHLAELLSNSPVEILAGKKVIELRPHGVHKGAIVAPLLERVRPRTLIVALGDDRTDEDLFEALPQDAVAVHVGPGASRATIRLATFQDARRLLSALA